MRGGGEGADGDGASGRGRPSSRPRTTGTSGATGCNSLRQPLPSLYCSQAFKAYLLSQGQAVRIPHYLHSVGALDEKQGGGGGEAGALPGSALHFSTGRRSGGGDRAGSRGREG